MASKKRKEKNEGDEDDESIVMSMMMMKMMKMMKMRRGMIEGKVRDGEKREKNSPYRTPSRETRRRRRARRRHLFYPFSWIRCMFLI